MRENPLYLRGFAPRRRRAEAFLTFLFFAVIVAVNYFVFFADRGPEEPDLEQRLAKISEASVAEFMPRVESEAPKALRVEEAVLMRGETLTGALMRLGVSPKSAASALSVLEGHVNLRTLRPGQKVVVELQEDGTLERLNLQEDLTRYMEVTRNGDAYSCARKEVETSKEVVQIACMIRTSFFASLAQCGADEELASVLVELLEGQIDFYADLRRGDIVRFAVERETLDGKFVRYGKVLGVLYEGRVVKASAFPAELDGKKLYYDMEGRSVERMFRRSPLKYTRVSSDFALRRLHPILHTYTPHRAVDYAAPRGTPVYAVGDGKVIFKGRKGAAGQMVVLQHDGDIQTYYAHLDKFAKGLQVGDFVKKGTLIGTVGSTGRATGPHLHFAVAKAGRFVHPRTLLAVAAPPIPEALEPEFKARVARTISELKALPIRGVEGSRS